VCELVEKYASNRKNVAVLGVAFKGDTNDTRFTPAFQIYDYLKDKGFTINLTDPYVFDSKIHIEKDEFAALRDSDIMLILTDHKQYININLKKIADVMNKNSLIIDTRGIINRNEAVRLGFEYHGLGRL
jgi:UDPglucose 6-dehydrogenase